MQLYETISHLCENRGINITQMCKACGASRGSLTDLKSGRKKTLAAATLQLIADYFNVSVDYLLTGDTETKPEEVTAVLADAKSRLLKAQINGSPPTESEAQLLHDAIDVLWKHFSNVRKD